MGKRCGQLNSFKALLYLLQDVSELCQLLAKRGQILLFFRKVRLQGFDLCRLSFELSALLFDLRRLSLELSALLFDLCCLGH